jgi:glycosyltransferase involved in cell wall biosynthesis
MRLAVVTSYFPIRDQPQRGHSAYQTLRAMPKGMDIEVFCPFTVYPSWFQPRNFTHHQADLTYSPPDVRAHYIEYPGLPVLSRPFNGFNCARHLIPHLKRFKPDVILNYNVYPEGYAAVSAGRQLEVPVVLGAIGSDLNRIPDTASRWLTRKTLQRASFVLTVSCHLREQAIRLGAAPDRTRAVLNGCDTSIFHLSDRQAARVELGLEPDALLIVFAGWIAPTKGLRELLNAFIRLADTHGTLQLACLGEGACLGELERRAQAAGLQSRVRFPGQCKPAQVARWIAAANVFCLPSYAEGLPNVVIEALASGRPVVASQVGGIPELVDSDCGILVPPRNSEALADALGQALALPWDELAIARKFRRGWDQVAIETEQILIEAIESGKRLRTAELANPHGTRVNL